jgi:hypothetical protein
MQINRAFARREVVFSSASSTANAPNALMKRSASVTTNLRLHAFRNRLAAFTRGDTSAESVSTLILRLRAQGVSEGSIAAVIGEMGITWDPSENTIRKP